MAFLTGAGTKQGTFTSSNEAEEKHAGPGHLDVFVACYLLFASHNSWSANIFGRRDHCQFGEDHEAMHHQEARFHHVFFCREIVVARPAGQKANQIRRRQGWILRQWLVTSSRRMWNQQLSFSRHDQEPMASCESYYSDRYYSTSEDSAEGQSLIFFLRVTLSKISGICFHFFIQGRRATRRSSWGWKKIALSTYTWFQSNGLFFCRNCALSREAKRNTNIMSW